MKNQWLAYVIVAVISALAGVAIAGPPNSVGTDATIIVPETAASTTTLAPVTTLAATTTTVAEGNESSTTTSTTSTTTTEAPQRTTTTTEADPEVAAADLVVVSVNGAGTSGLATRVRDQLREAGFTAARATDGTDLVDATIVYFFPTFEREAVRVAEALDLRITDVRPADESPAYGELTGDQVAVYLGRDRS